jgi:hypothetical protein
MSVLCQWFNCLLAEECYDVYTTHSVHSVHIVHTVHSVHSVHIENNMHILHTVYIVHTVHTLIFTIDGMNHVYQYLSSFLFFFNVKNAVIMM